MTDRPTPAEDTIMCLLSTAGEPVVCNGGCSLARCPHSSDGGAAESDEGLHTAWEIIGG
jgi:hypothetical protein